MKPGRSELVPWQALTSCVGHNRPGRTRKQLKIAYRSPYSHHLANQSMLLLVIILGGYWKNAGLPIRRTLAHSPSPRICLRSANRSNRRLICVPLLVLGALKGQEGRGIFCVCTFSALEAVEARLLSLWISTFAPRSSRHPSGRPSWRPRFTDGARIDELSECISLFITAAAYQRIVG